VTDVAPGNSGESMQTHGTRIAIAALSGLTIAGSLAGCSVAHTGAAGTRHGSSATGTAVAAGPTPSASAAPTTTPIATSAPKTAAKPTLPAPVHHVAAPPKPVPKSPVKPKPKPAPPAVTYANGNYTALGSYTSPGGKETLRVTLTLASEIITSMSVTSVMVDPTAAGYEADFEAGVNAVVVGRNITSIHVGAIGGSSLTSLGFNSALATIKAKAKN
jgi:uncharacterized protein with FMN-binding domain